MKLTRYYHKCRTCKYSEGFTTANDSPDLYGRLVFPYFGVKNYLQKLPPPTNTAPDYSTVCCFGLLTPINKWSLKVLNLILWKLRAKSEEMKKFSILEGPLCPRGFFRPDTNFCYWSWNTHHQFAWWDATTCHYVMTTDLLIWPRVTVRGGRCPLALSVRLDRRNSAFSRCHKNCCTGWF